MDATLLVRMRTQYAGPHGACPPGGTIRLPKAAAMALVQGGYAAIVEGEPMPAALESPRPPADPAVAPEAAALRQPEPAMRPAARPRGPRGTQAGPQMPKTPARPAGVSGRYRAEYSKLPPFGRWFVYGPDGKAIHPQALTKAEALALAERENAKLGVG